MHIQKCKDAARVTQLMNRLVDHSVGKVEMTSTQVQAASIVLKKLRPDLSSVSVGQDEALGPVQITWTK
jgi:hypothetical protein